MILPGPLMWSLDELTVMSCVRANLDYGGLVAAASGEQGAALHSGQRIRRENRSEKHGEQKLQTRLAAHQSHSAPDYEHCGQSCVRPVLERTAVGFVPEFQEMLVSMEDVA